MTMDDKKMDKFVFCVAQKRAAARLHKDMYDLVMFCFIILKQCILYLFV